LTPNRPNVRILSNVAPVPPETVREMKNSDLPASKTVPESSELFKP
jgi:hypothetical protein